MNKQIIERAKTVAYFGFWMPLGFGIGAGIIEIYYVLFTNDTQMANTAMAIGIGMALIAEMAAILKVLIAQYTTKEE